MDESRPAGATAVCILNAAAGSDRAAKERSNLEALFAKLGKTVRLVLAHGGNDIVRVAKDAAAQNGRLVLAAGGDGTINTVAGVLAGTNTALAVLPCGTLNHFAKDLKIPLKLEDAVANAFVGEVARIDVGEVNGRIFLNNSSLGLYPGLVKVRETLQRSGYGKWPAFARAVIFALWRYSPLTVRLSLEDETRMAVTTPFVFVGNNRYELAAPRAGERASLQEGKLSIYQAPHAGRAKLFILALQALIGREHKADLVILDAEAFEIRLRTKRVRVANDGEVIVMTSPLRYRSKPGALRVIVPKGSVQGGL